MNQRSFTNDVNFFHILAKHFSHNAKDVSNIMPKINHTVKDFSHILPNIFHILPKYFSHIAKYVSHILSKFRQDWDIFAAAAHD